MNDEQNTTNQEFPIGLYRDPESGKFLGSIDPMQSNALVRAGWVLHTEGREAAMATASDIETLMNPPDHETSQNKRSR